MSGRAIAAGIKDQDTGGGDRCAASNNHRGWHSFLAASARGLVGGHESEGEEEKKPLGTCEAREEEEGGEPGGVMIVTDSCVLVAEATPYYSITVLLALRSYSSTQFCLPPN